MKLRLIKNKLIDPIWEVPIFYKLLQATLAGGGHSVIKDFLISQIPKKAKTILDQGCGTGEYSLLFGDRYIGIDNSEADILHARKRYPGKFVIGSAANMKQFKNNCFDAVFAVGLHHHLSDNLAKKAFQEAVRVCKKGGKIIVIDAMWPKNPFNIIGVFLRKMDRGGNVRFVHETFNLLPNYIDFEYQILSSFPFDYLTLVAKKN